MARLAPNYLVNDCTVPRTLLPEALAKVAEIIRSATGSSIGNVFHAGDGNLHPLILFDSRDPGQLERVHAAGWEIMQACVALGGTISGEHGIGMEKMEGMRLVFSDDDIAAQRSLQQAIDPLGVLNPGKMFPDTSRPFAFRETAAWAAPADRLSAAEGDVAAAVGRALAAGEALLPVGGDSLGGFGNAPARPLTPLRTDRLDAIVELDPSNQSFTAGAGMTLGAVQAALAAHNQWLPLRPAFGLTRRTLGGITATGACGPERHGLRRAAQTPARPALRGRPRPPDHRRRPGREKRRRLRRDAPGRRLGRDAGRHHARHATGPPPGRSAAP